MVTLAEIAGVGRSLTFRHRVQVAAMFIPIPYTDHLAMQVALANREQCGDIDGGDITDDAILATLHAMQPEPTDDPEEGGDDILDTD